MGIVIATVSLGQPRLARAETTCGTDKTPWILVRFADAGWAETERRAMLDQFAAGLAEDGTQACFDGGPEPPVAEITVDTTEPNHANIDILDHSTKKRVIRPADFTSVPADGRPLALAIAVDDLLKATWAELRLRSREKESATATKPAPPPVTTIRRPRRAPTPLRGFEPAIFVKPSWFFGVGAELGYDVGDAAVPGGFAFARVWPTDSLGVRLTLHGNRSLPVDVALGRVEYWAVGGRARFTYVALSTSTVRFGPALELGAELVSFVPTAGANALAEPASGLAVLAGVGIDLEWYFARSWGLVGAAGVRPVVRRLEATADGTAIGGVRFLQVFGELGLGGGF